jgi:hypothetical protein
MSQTAWPGIGCTVYGAIPDMGQEQDFDGGGRPWVRPAACPPPPPQLEERCRWRMDRAKEQGSARRAAADGEGRQHGLAHLRLLERGWTSVGRYHPMVRSFGQQKRNWVACFGPSLEEQWRLRGVRRLAGSCGKLWPLPLLGASWLLLSRRPRGGPWRRSPPQPALSSLGILLPVGRSPRGVVSPSCVPLCTCG